MLQIQDFMKKLCYIGSVYRTHCHLFYKLYTVVLVKFFLTYSSRLSPSPPLSGLTEFALRSQFSSVIFHDWLWITEVSPLVSVTAVAEKYRRASTPHI